MQNAIINADTKLVRCTNYWYCFCVKLSTLKLRQLCRKRHLNLSRLLQETGVSRNAYYTLARKRSVLPKSVIAIADQLDVSPSAFLEDHGSSRQKARALLSEVDAVMRRHRHADRDNVRHTLLLLQKKLV